VRCRGGPFYSRCEPGVNRVRARSRCRAQKLQPAFTQHACGCEKGVSRASTAGDARSRVPQSRRRFCGAKCGTARPAQRHVELVKVIAGALVAALRSRASLVLENLCAPATARCAAPGYGTVSFPHQLESRRRGPEPHRRRLRLHPRSLVEPGCRSTGGRSRPPYRSEQTRLYLSSSDAAFVTRPPPPPSPSP